MEPFWISFLHIFFLCAAVCIDTFAAAFGFGIDQIRIPALSALVLSLVSSAALSLSMLAAGWLTPYLPAGLTGWPVSYTHLWSQRRFHRGHTDK